MMYDCGVLAGVEDFSRVQILALQQSQQSIVVDLPSSGT
jgi:hypothetical protein